MSKSHSAYVCETCGLPLQRMGSGWKHAANAATSARSCGSKPVPLLRAAQPVRAGMEVKVWRPAGVVTVNHQPFRQRFRPQSYQRLMHTVTPLYRGGEVVAHCEITRIDAAKDGSGVEFTMTVIDSAEEAA